MAYETIALETDARGIATLTLNRPEVHNAMNGLMWEEGLEATQRLAADDAVRAVVLAGAGKSFCSGADLKYQLAQREAGTAEKAAEADKFVRWLQALDTLPKLLIGRIQGPAYAGALGLISVCDLAIGVDSLVFAITEARLGLMPAMISPYVMRRLGGAAKARRYFLNGRRFDAQEALSVGLLDRVVAPQELDRAIEEEIGLLLQCGPQAVGKIKQLIAHVAHLGFEQALSYTPGQVIGMWDSAEAAEGMASFLEKRKPAWVAAVRHENGGSEDGQ
ncbi:enoyl-CoA hydratase-related protein [Castellaniella sp.]|uniref:enoyl-CoA hydratase-related protein n=1 Tax=Castellaniella sp. TaxID=1955812 RepID=UPI00355D9F11